MLYAACLTELFLPPISGMQLAPNIIHWRSQESGLSVWLTKETQFQNNRTSLEIPHVCYLYDNFFSWKNQPCPKYWTKAGLISNLCWCQFTNLQLMCFPGGLVWRIFGKFCRHPWLIPGNINGCGTCPDGRCVWIEEFPVAALGPAYMLWGRIQLDSLMGLKMTWHLSAGTFFLCFLSCYS